MSTDDVWAEMQATAAADKAENSRKTKQLGVLSIQNQINKAAAKSKSKKERKAAAAPPPRKEVFMPPPPRSAVTDAFAAAPRPPPAPPGGGAEEEGAGAPPAEEPTAASAADADAAPAAPAAPVMVPDLEDGEDVVEKKKKAKVINYASMDAGAVVLEQSEHSKGFHKLLLDDKDKYGITECSEKKMVVIGLSEDIQMRELILCQYEKYSSGVRDFDVLGSQAFPTKEWLHLGNFTAKYGVREQNFTMAEFKYVRYLKLRFLTHHGDEASCTVSQIKVHGVAVGAGTERFKFAST